MHRCMNAFFSKHVEGMMNPFGTVYMYTLPRTMSSAILLVANLC